MKKILTKKVCPVCLYTYQPNSYNQKFCNDCLKNRCSDVKKYRLKLKEERSLKYNDKYFGQRGIHTINAEIEEYNKKHGTCLTYGKYVQAKTCGLLEE